MVLIKEGFEVYWTGKGPDGGRDLMLVEKAMGYLEKFERTWLVQFKHFAHSVRSVGKVEANSIIVDCERIKAKGYLLVSTNGT